MLEALRGRSGVAIVLACAATAVVLGIAETSFQRASTSLGSLGARGQARTAVQQLMRRILDGETAQRGFLLTGREQYLAPFDEVNTDITDALAVLRQHYAQDPKLAATVEELTRRTLEKISEISATIALHKAGRHEAWREVLLSDIGREKMEAVRALAETLLATEDLRVVEERAYVFKTLHDGRIGVRAMTLLCLLTLVFFLRKSDALHKAQNSHALALRAERDLLETEVHQRTAELTELTRHLQHAREDERGRLARELHDELGALLTAAKLDVARLRRALGAPTPELTERLQHLIASIDQGIALKRRIIEDLRPSSLSNLGLTAALEIQAREFEVRSGLPVQVQLEEASLSDDAQIVIYRIVQEAFTNIAKHARASRIHLMLRPQGAQAALRIADDGQGFNLVGRRLGAHGLLGMRYRVESVGGTFSIDTALNRGTTILALVPMRGETPETVPAPTATTAELADAPPAPTNARPETGLRGTT
jgi:signal transduction histidine kinase